jgi:hypothetical protein
LALSQIGPESHAIPESEEPLAGSRSGPLDTIQRVSVLVAGRDGRHPRKTAEKLPLNCEGQVFAQMGLGPPLRDRILSAPAGEPPGAPMHGVSPGNGAGPCAAAPFDRTIIRSLQGGVLKSGIPTPILKRLGIPRRPPGDNS